MITPWAFPITIKSGGGLCVSAIHPVLHHYSAGKMVNAVHMQSGVFVRYDAPNAAFATEWDWQKPHNVIFNLISDIVKGTDETVTVHTFTDGEVAGFTSWPPDRRYEGAALPQCIQTHQPDYVPDLAY